MRGAQRGMVLISSLLLLIVVTIIALSMFRSFGMQEKIAGNMREKQRAFQGAVSAQEFAENWLINIQCNASTGRAARVRSSANIGRCRSDLFRTAVQAVPPRSAT
jgi:type IV pilus assembly protein PilX